MSFGNEIVSFDNVSLLRFRMFVSMSCIYSQVGVLCIRIFHCISVPCLLVMDYQNSDWGILTGTMHEWLLCELKAICCTYDLFVWENKADV